MKNNYRIKNLFRNIFIILSILISHAAISQPCVNPPTASAGSDASICANAYFSLDGVGSIGGSASSADWSSSGSGTFSPSNVFGTVGIKYTPTLADINAGSVILTLSTDDPDGLGPCNPAVSTMTLTITKNPLNGTYTVDNSIPNSCSNFTSIAGAVNYFNAYGVSGNVVFNIAPGYVETAPSGGIILVQCGLASGIRSGVSQTVTFIKNGVGTNPKINAPVGSGGADFVVAISGADYITFDGIDIAESGGNVTNSTRMEYGYLLYPCSSTDGAQNNTIKNCGVTLSSSNTNLTYGISINNLGINASTTGGTDSNNKLYSNTIANAYYGVYCFGTASTSPYALYDSGNEIGDVGQGNTITGFGSATVTSAPAAGIYTKYNTNVIVRGNTLTALAGNVNSIRGIFTDRAMHANTTVENNTITVSVSASASGSISSYGIYNTSGGRKNRADNISNTININSNTVTGSTYPSVTSGPYYSIYNSADLDAAATDSLSANIVNINSNTITNNSSAVNPATNRIDSSFIQIFSQWAVGTLNINSNTITGNNYTGTVNTSNRGIVTGFGYASISNWTQVTNIQNNTLTNNNSTTSTAADGGSIHNIDEEIYGSLVGGSAAGSQFNVTGNTMGSVNQGSLAKTGKYRGVLAPLATNVTYNISTNSIKNVTRSSMTGTFIGYQTTISAATINAGNVTLNADTVAIISTGGTTADAFTGISTVGGPNTVLNVNNNKIYSVTMTTATVGTFTGITGGTTNPFVSNPAPTVNLKNNAVYSCTVSNVSSTSTVSFYGIVNVGTSITNITLDFDTIQNNIHNGNTTTSNTFCIASGNGNAVSVTNCLVKGNTKNTTVASGFNLITGNSLVSGAGSGATSTNTMSNNTVSDNTMAGTGSTGNLTCLAGGGGTIMTMANNIVNNNIKSGSGGGGQFYCMVNNSAPTVLNVTSNTITNNGYSNITTTTGSGTLYGYACQSGTPFNVNFTGNTIDNLTISGSGSGASTGATIYGIYDQDGAEYATKNYSGNSISNLKINSNFNLNTVIGLRTLFSSTISKNKIFSLLGNGAGGNVTGIYTERGPITIVNNYVGDLTAPASTSNSAITSLYANTLYATTLNVYFNTFKIGAATGGGTGFGTSNIQLDNIAISLNLRNNILINLGSPGGLTSGSNGAVVCVRRLNGSTLSTYLTSSNNNIFYAGAAGPNALLYLEGLTPNVANANGKQDIATLRTYLGSGRESLSNSEDVVFTSNTAGNPSFLHVDPATATYAESGAVSISGITTDYDNDTRASTPDIGADEFSGIIKSDVPVISNVSITPAGSQCSSSTSRTVNADVNITSGSISTVTLNYSFNGVTQSPVSMSILSGNTWTGIIPASTPTNANVDWNITATSAASPSIGTYYSGISYKDNFQTGYSTTASASPASICDGSSSTLSVNTNNLISGDGQIGIQGTATVSNVSPFRLGNFSNATGNPPAGNKVQILYLGSELQAAGLVAGNITAISFYVPSISSFPANSPMPNFTVKMGTTSISTMPAIFFQPDPATPVYGPTTTNYPAAPGVWTLTFTTPFNWDGVSNVLIQYCNTAAPNNTFTSLTVLADAAQTYKGSFQQNDASSPCTNPSCTANNGARPIIIFTGTKLQNVTSSINYIWNPGSLNGSSVSVSPSASTTYTVSGTDANGCTVSAAPIAVTVTPVPSTPSANGSSQCGTQTPTASVTGTGGTFKWYLVSSGGTALAGQSGSTLVNYPISTTTTFYVSEFSNGCEGPRTAVVAQVVAQPDAITALASATSNICPYTNETLSVSHPGSNNNYVYTWTASPVSGSGIPTSVSGSPVIIQATAGGTYTYTVTGYDATSQCATTSTVTVIYTNPPVTPVPTANPASYCSGGSTMLSANAYTQVNNTLSAVPATTANITGLQGSANMGWDIKNISSNPITIHYFTYGAYIGGVGLTTLMNIYYKPGGINCVLPTTTDFPSSWSYAGTASVTPTDLIFNGVYTTIPLDVNVTIPAGQTYAFCIQGSYVAYLNTSGVNCTTVFPGQTANDGNLQTFEGYGGNTGSSWSSSKRFIGTVSYDYKITNNSYTYNWTPTSGLASPTSSTTSANPTSTTTYTVQVTDPATSCTNYGSVTANVTPLPSAPTANNNTQCGAGIPNCSVTGTGSSYKWYLASSGGTALAGESGIQLTAYSISTTTTFYVSQIVNTCEGPRVAVVQTVGGTDPILASSSSPTCFGSVVNLTVAKTSNTFGSNYTYTWTASPYTGSGISSSTPGDVTDGHLDVTPTINNGTYVYTVTGYDGVSGCYSVSSVTVTVASPPSITAPLTANPNPVCAGSNLNLTATTTVATPYTKNIGTGLNNVGNGSIGPFPGGNENHKVQYLILASELSGMGLPANTAINQISFQVIYAAPGIDWNNYTISLGHTAQAALAATNASWVSGLSTVFTGTVAATSLPTNGGLRTFNFSSPFTWNGTQNLIVEICYSNDQNGSCSGCVNGNLNVQIGYTVTPGATVHSFGQQDFSICSNPTPGNGSIDTRRVNMVFAGNYPTQGAGTHSWSWSPGNLSGNSIIVNPIAPTTYTVTATAAGSGCTSTASVAVNTNTAPAAPISNGPSSQCGYGVPTTSVNLGSGNLHRWYLVPTGGTSIPGETGTSLISYTISTTTTFYVSDFDGSCESTRTPAVANVSTPDAISATAVSSTCLNAPLALSATQTGNTNGNVYTYSWTAAPASGSGIPSSTAGQNVNVTPTIAGTYTYTVTATDASQSCVTTSQAVVLVNALPHIDNVTTSSNPVCSTYPVTLTAKTFVNTNATSTVGTVTTTPITSGAIPFGLTAETQRVQYLILASELQAAGFPTGSAVTINKLTFSVASAGATVGWDAYTIKMGNSSIASYTNTIGSWENTLTTVYGPTNLAPTAVVSGNNIFTFTTPFTWNGTSNLAIDICWANDPLNLCANCSSTGIMSVNSTSTPFNSVHFNTASNTSLCGSSPAGTVAITRPNMILQGTSNVLGAGSYNWQWNPGGLLGNTVSTIPVATTTYTVTAVDQLTNCSNTSSITQNLIQSPPAPSGVNSTQCGTGIPTCSITTYQGNVLRWYYTDINTPLTGPIVGETGPQLTTKTISTTTTFYVSEFDGTCEGLKGTLIATVATQPDAIVASAPAAICFGSNLSLSSTKSGSTNSYSYGWTANPVSGSGIPVSTPGQNITITPNATGTYTYTVTGTDAVQGCATTSNVVVIVGPIPVSPQPVASPSTVCAGNTSQITTSSYSSNSYNLQAPMLASTSVTQGAYWFNVENVHTTPLIIHNLWVETFTSTHNGTVYYNSTPITNCNVAPTISGFTNLGTVAMTGLGTGLFSLVPLNTNITLQPGQSCAFAVSVDGIMYYGNANSQTCSPLANDTRLIIQEGFGGTIGAAVPGRNPVVKVDYEILIGSPNYTYSWTPGATLTTPTSANPIATPISTTTYTVVVTDPATGCTSSGDVAVNVGGISATPVISPSPISICNSGSSPLSVSNPDVGVSYTWQYSSNGNPGSWTTFGTGVNINSPVISNSTYFRVYATCGSNGDTSASDLATVIKPEMTSYTSVTLCGPGTTDIILSGTGDFDWYDSPSSSTPLAINTVQYTPFVSSNTVFYVQAYVGTCLHPGRQQVFVTVNTPPAISISANPGTSVCGSSPVTLTASSSNDPNYSYAWSLDGGNTFVATGTTYTFTPLSETAVYLLASDNTNGTYSGCLSFSTLDVTVKEVPATPVVSPANSAICTANACTNLTVTNPAVGNTEYPRVGPTNTSIGARTINGGLADIFTVSQTMTIKSVDIYFASPVGTPYSIEIVTNVGNIQVFNYSGLIAHQTNGTGTPDIVMLNATLSPGTYRIRFLIDPGTYNNSTGANFPYTLPGVMSIIGTDAFQSPSYYFYFYNWRVTTPEDAVYTWNPGGMTGTSQTVCPTATTTYTVSASYTNGCTSSASTVVTYDPIIDPVISASGPTTFCQGDNVTLDAGAGYTNYSWSDGANVVATTRTYIASPTSTTTYSVTVDNGGPCSASASMTVNILQLAPPTITSDLGTTFCANLSATLDAGTYNGYLWSTSATTQTISVNSANTYSVVVTGGNGCTASGSITISVNPIPPTAIVTPSGPVNLCSNGSNSPFALTADITGAGAGASVIWNQDGNPTTTSINVSAGDIDLLLNGNTFGYYFQVTNSFGCTTNSNIVTVNEVTCTGPTLYAKIYLEGYYSGPGSNIMDNVIIPPIGGLLYHVGTSTNPDDVDYVTLSAMDENFPYGLIESQTGILKRDGTIQVTYTTAVSNTGQYFIRVTHRNALETWSAAPVLLSATSAVSRYDFTTAASKAFGNYQADLGDGNWGLFSGDISDAGTGTVGLQDGIMESQDYGDMENAVFFTYVGYVTEDITGDGIVESADYALMENNVYFTRVVHRP